MILQLQEQSHSATFLEVIVGLRLSIQSEGDCFEFLLLLRLVFASACCFKVMDAVAFFLALYFQISVTLHLKRDS